MGKTVTVSDDIYKKLLRFKSHSGFSKILAGMKENLETLEIGFGSRNSREKERLKAELKEVEEDFQKWI